MRSRVKKFPRVDLVMNKAALCWQSEVDSVRPRAVYQVWCRCTTSARLACIKSQMSNSRTSPRLGHL